MRTVTDVCRIHGYEVFHTYDSRHSRAGFPDLEIIGHGRIFHRELKLDRGHTTPEQDAVIALINRNGGDARVWRPQDLAGTDHGRARRKGRSMRFCSDHWAELRTAIEKEGVYHLVARDGRQAVDQMADQLDRQKVTIANYDPLMGAHNMILSRCMDIVGMQIMFADPDGSDRCPICYLKREAPEHEVDPAQFDDWIPGAAHAAGDIARKLIDDEAKA